MSEIIPAQTTVLVADALAGSRALLCTLLSDQDNRVVEVGADGFLTEPLSKDELLAGMGPQLRANAFSNELLNSNSVLFGLALESGT